MMIAKSRSLLVLLALMLLFASTACRAHPRVVIPTKEGGDLVFQVEIADTPAKRELGLQYRRELASNRGMLFLFPAESNHSFWMKNTSISLDMIFIDREQRIVGIVEEAVAFSLEPRSVAAPSQFVLEISGGLSRRYGFKVGDRVRFEDVSSESVKD